jgi:hypothetical protein
MKTLLTSVLGLAAMTSVALAGEPMYLTASQMDMVTAGASSFNVTFTGTAAGPTNSNLTAEVTGSAITVGGLAPSNTSTVSVSVSGNAE